MANPYFYASFYLQQNRDLQLAGLNIDNVEDHYNTYGAAEGRQPNPWFDADFYLLANPDLIAAGLGRADALAHYAQYGVKEGRSFNADPDMSPADFDFEFYAEEHPDVAEALGITDLEDLTEQQQNALLGHYLAYGLREGRAALPPTFVDAVSADLAIEVVNTAINLGTSGDDVFDWDATGVTDPTINGLAGNDELIVNNAATGATVTVTNVENITVSELSADADLTVTGNGVQNVAVNTGSSIFTYEGRLVEAVEVAGAGELIANFDEDDVEGEGTALNVTAARGATFTTEGVENVTLNVLNAGANDPITLNLDEIEGEELNVTVNTDVKEFFLVVDSVTAPADDELETVTIDASGATNGISITLGVGLNANADLDVFLTGGDANDILVANAGIDELTGGAGNDVFTFTAAAARFDGTEIVGVDTILDFENGDTVDYTGTTAVAETIAAIGEVNAEGVLTYNFGYTGDLEQIVTDLGGATGSVLFDYEGDAYLVSSATDLIKFVGVSAADLAVTADTVAYAS